MRRYGENHQKYPKNGFFPPFVTPQDFFSKIGLYSLLYPYGALFMQKIRKNQCTVSEIIKDGRTDHGQGRLLRTPLGEPGVQYVFPPS